MEEEDKENCPIGEELCSRLNDFHDRLMTHVSLKALLAPAVEEVHTIYEIKLRLMMIIINHTFYRMQMF